MIVLLGVNKMKKKTLIVLILALISQFLFATETIWMWEHNDSDVNFFRYSTTYDDKWRVVPSDHYSIKLDSGEIDDYEFFLQQSYDGVNWSESSSKVHEGVKNVTVDKATVKEKGLVLSLQLVPFESYIATKPHDSRVEKKTEYSLGIDGEVSYFFEKFGFGALVSANIGWEEFSLIPLSYNKERIYGGAYLTLLYRILDGKRFVILSELGFGTNFEVIDNVSYLSPSILIALEGGIRLNDNVTLSMKPSFISSFGSWNGGEYASFVIKTISIGSSYRF